MDVGFPEAVIGALEGLVLLLLFPDEPSPEVCGCVLLRLLGHSCRGVSRRVVKINYR